MSIEIVKHNESKVHLRNIEMDLALGLKDYFSFFIEGAQFSPKFRAGLWNGKINLFDMRTCMLPLGLLPKLESYLTKNNYEYSVDEQLKPVNFDHITDEYILNLTKELGLKFEPRDYQLNAIKVLLKQNKAIATLPTGSGKSMCYYILSQILLKEVVGTRILLIVPSVSLVEQMEYDFIDYDPNVADKIHKIYSGKSKSTDKQIVISTWQSLATMKTAEDMKWFQSFNTILVDETHKCCSDAKDAKIITEILQERCTRSKYRFGMTGSVKDGKVNDIQLNAVIGPIFDSVTTKDLIDRNLLSSVKIKMLLLKNSQENCLYVSKMDYPTEMKFIIKQKERAKFILKMFRKINNNSLVIFKNLEYGKLLYKYLQQLYPDRPVYYVDGSVDADTREKIRLSIEGHTDAIIVASMPIFSTGINIPKLKYLILAQSFKSKITLIQSIGRTLRKHADKDGAVIIDIVDDFEIKRHKNYALKHALERIKQYESQSFPYTIKEIIL